MTTSRYVVSWASCSSLSACNVFVSGSHTAWLIPTTWPSGPTRKTVELETVERSIGAENGIEILGWMLNPSSVSRTSMSAQSDGWMAQSGFGRSTRRPVICVPSCTV
ncbi:MAG: hypothetical protein E6I48_14605 [Chloroflexi bacterium]|nr:MAG: hypothetical protein E6I48_14605 [Chloroflexota bacterium]